MAHIDLNVGKKYLGKHYLPSEVGTKDNHFALESVRKGGGNGIVFAAKHYQNESLSRTCAVKFLRRLDSARRDRFSNEIRVLRALNHENISQYYGDGSVDLNGNDVPWLAQELGDRNLREHVQNRGPLEPDKLVLVGAQMCAAAQHVNDQGFIHRDIKPDNFVWVEGSDSEILMIDLGIAKQLGEDVSARPMDSFTRTLEFVGPVFYSSPELIAYAHDKRVPVDARSDVFQLAKAIWFLATGSISSGVPSKKLCPFGGALRNLVVEAIDDDPDSRPQSAEALGLALKELG